jgi:hypothetical protein
VDEKMKQRLSSLPCPVCGGSNYKWGDLLAVGYRFHPENMGLLSRAASTGGKCPGRQCKDCGNVQSFLAVSET